MKYKNFIITILCGISITTACVSNDNDDTDELTNKISELENELTVLKDFIENNDYIVDFSNSMALGSGHGLSFTFDVYRTNEDKDKILEEQTRLDLELVNELIDIKVIQDNKEIEYDLNQIDNSTIIKNNENGSVEPSINHFWLIAYPENGSDMFFEINNKLLNKTYRYYYPYKDSSDYGEVKSMTSCEQSLKSCPEPAFEVK